MFCHGRARSLLAAGALIVAAACSDTPTSPSPASSSQASSTAEGADPNAAATAQHVIPVGGVGATRFLAFGDSITAGVESRFDEVLADFVLLDGTPVSYPTQLRSVLSGLFPPQAAQFSVVNAGVGAETAATGAQRLPGVLASTRPQVLLLLEGINDMGGGGRSVGETVGYLQTMVDTARLYDVTVLIANMFQTYPTQFPDGTFNSHASERIQPFNAAIAQMIQGRQNVFLVDLYNSFETYPGDKRSLIGNDGLHPTPTGYQRMAERFASTIAQVFPVRGAFQ